MAESQVNKCICCGRFISDDEVYCLECKPFEDDDYYDFEYDEGCVDCFDFGDDLER